MDFSKHNPISLYLFMGEVRLPGDEARRELLHCISIRDELFLLKPDRFT